MQHRELGEKGSEERGVEKVTVSGAAFVGTGNGLRIKTWGAGGALRHLRARALRDARNPVIIDRNYCPDHGPRRPGCPHQGARAETNQSSDVTYTDIQGSSASKVAVKFDCSASHPCSGLGLEDIKLTFAGGKPAEATRQHVDGTASSGILLPPSSL
ncbi:hypothetical protein ABZP36_016843 [Zizania latifolia]